MIIYKLITFTLIVRYSSGEDNIDNEETAKNWKNPGHKRPVGSSNDDCLQRIYRDCNYPKTFTDEELENVRQYLNYSFTVLADIKPDVPLCPKLHVRQDWKCLNNNQRVKLSNIWKQMYDSGFITNLTDLHVKTWPAWHKTPEFLPTHRWFINTFEKEMRRIDPTVSLPYWEPTTYATQPERASLWDFLGHSGNYSNGYCVDDGVYGRYNLVPCIKRHWTDRGTIYPWDTPEFQTFFIQMGTTFGDLNRKSYCDHFIVHINVGGYEGQYAVRSAPYDLLFYLHHNSRTENIFYRWQLLKQANLTPLSYSALSVYDQTTGAIKKADLENDYLTAVPGFRTKQNFWLGFGDMCHITDQLVRPINNLMKKKMDPKPTAVNRMSEYIKAKYFPLFFARNYTGLAHVLEEVGQCNTRCNPIPKPTFLEETQIGRAQLEAFQYDNGHDNGFNLVFSENTLYQFWMDLMKSGYCSPYVTTY